MDHMNSAPGTQPGPGADFAHPMGPGFGKTLGDMRFMAWVGMIYGILTCLSIVGAIVGVPLIIAAQRFIEGLNRLENYRHERSEAELKAGFHELGRSFRVMKILTIIYLVLTVGSLAFMFLLGGIGILSEIANN